MSTLTVKELAAPTGYDLKIASGETLDLNSQGTVVLPTVPTSKLGTGAVLQVVTGTRTGNFSTSSTSFVSTGLSASITPSSTSSKILVYFQSGMDCVASGRTAYCSVDRTVGGSGTNLGNSGEGMMALSSSGGTRIPLHLHTSDSPNTTSACTYSLTARSHTGDTIEFPAFSSGVQSVTLMEVAG